MAITAAQPVKIWLAAAVFLLGSYLTAAAAYTPLRGKHYVNVDYEFSVQIPNRFLACVSENSNNGVDILLDRSLRCDSNYRDRPFIDVSANYNAAGEARSAAGLARIYCADQDVRKVVWLRDWMLGDRAAAGCRQYFDRGIIRVQLITLRKTDPQNFEAWIMVSVSLTTTAERYKSDMRVFRQIARTVRIAPDGPQK